MSLVNDISCAVTKTRLGLTISDRVVPLLDGSLPHYAATLDIRPTGTEEMFRGMLGNNGLEASEMSLAMHCILCARGDTRLVGIPVFLSRMFRHGGIIVNRQAGIRRPEDLAGKRIGVPDFQMTAAVWIRGFLNDDYGIDSRSIKWITAGLNVPRANQRMALETQCYDVVHCADTTLDQLLQSGDIDAVMTASMPRCFHRQNRNIVRLFDDVRAAEAAYFDCHRFIPIMHVVVLRREAYERERGLAQGLYKAFDVAKTVAMQRLADPNFLMTMLPWQHPELDATRQLMGDDYWPYGVARNRSCLAEFLQQLRRQELISRTIDVGDLFASETLNT